MYKLGLSSILKTLPANYEATMDSTWSIKISIKKQLLWPLLGQYGSIFQNPSSCKTPECFSKMRHQANTWIQFRKGLGKIQRAWYQQYFNNHLAFPNNTCSFFTFSGFFAREEMWKIRPRDIWVGFHMLIGHPAWATCSSRMVKSLPNTPKKLFRMRLKLGSSQSSLPRMAKLWWGNDEPLNHWNWGYKQMHGCKHYRYIQNDGWRQFWVSQYVVATMWGPRSIAKLVYNSHNYGLWYL